MCLRQIWLQQPLHFLSESTHEVVKVEHELYYNICNNGRCAHTASHKPPQHTTQSQQSLRFARSTFLGTFSNLFKSLSFCYHTVLSQRQSHPRYKSRRQWVMKHFVVKQGKVTTRYRGRLKWDPFIYHTISQWKYMRSAGHIIFWRKRMRFLRAFMVGKNTLLCSYVINQSVLYNEYESCLWFWDSTSRLERWVLQNTCFNVR